MSAITAAIQAALIRIGVAPVTLPAIPFRRSHPMRLFALVLSFTLLVCASASANESNKWRLQFSGAAESAGTMVFEIAPRGQTPVQVTVTIERNDGENRVARKVKNAIGKQAKAWVNAELDDGEDVLVKRRLGKPPVVIILVSSSVEDVRVNFDKE